MSKVSLISNTLNNVLGFGGIIGATVRYNYLEKFVEEDDKKNLKKSISFMLFSMLSGIAVLSILVVIGVFDSSNLIEDYPYVKVALIALSIILPIYLVYTLIKPPLESDRFLVIKYTMVSVLDYLFVGCIMFLSLRFVGANVNFMNMISIFVVASIAGVISMIPGGIGVFDVIFLMGATTQLNLSEEVVLLAVIFYRLCYNILPFFLGSLVALTEFQTVLTGKFKEQSIVLFTKEFGSIIFSFS